MGHSGRVLPRELPQRRGENVRKSQVSARYEPRDLHLSRAVSQTEQLRAPTW